MHAELSYVDAYAGIPNMYFITPSSFQRPDMITSNNPILLFGGFIRQTFTSSMQMQHK